MRRIQDRFPPPRQRVSSTSDAELLANFRERRDESSFQEIVLRHGRMVLTATRQVLGSQTDAEDVVQATFLALFQRPAAIRRGQSLGSWLYGVAHRLALQHCRSTNRRLQREQLSEVRSLDETTRQVASAELQAEVARALQAIPEPYRQAIIYCYLEERSPEAAARLLGCPVGTLWSRLARGREKLRAILARRGWNLELPAIALVLSASEGSAQAAAQIWHQLKELVHWQPHAAMVTPIKPVLAGLLLKEKIMFSLRSVMSSVVVVGLMLCGVGLGINVLGQTTGEPPAKAPQPTIDIKPLKYPADWKGRLRGTITAADTGKPLAGATVTVGLDGVEEKYRLVEATSGADGKYAVPLPVGHAMLFGLCPPPGYYTKDERTYSQMAIQDAVDAVFDFKLLRGMAWNIQSADVPPSASKPPRFIASIVAPPGSILPSGSSLRVLGNLQGKAVLTLPRAWERYRITSFWPESGLFRGANAVLEFDGQFDPQKIAGPPEILAEGKGQIIKDHAGRIAKLEEAEFVVEGKNVTIRMTSKKLDPKEPSLIFLGKVVDEQNKPVEGVEAFLAFHTQTGGIMTEFKTTTTSEGIFKFDGLKKSDIRAQRSEFVTAIVRRKGYAGEETQKHLMATIRKKGNGDFGTLILKPGLTLRGRVVDGDGKPVHGALVTNLTNIFLYDHLRCRTDAAGRFTMNDLAEGKHSIEVQYGKKSAYVSDELHPKSEEVEFKLQPRSGTWQDLDSPDKAQSDENKSKK